MAGCWMQQAGSWDRQSASPKRSSEGWKHSKDILQQLVLEGLRQELDQMALRVRQVMRQTRARIFRGNTRSEGKLLNLFEPQLKSFARARPASRESPVRVAQLRVIINNQDHSGIGHVASRPIRQRRVYVFLGLEWTEELDQRSHQLIKKARQRLTNGGCSSLDV